ncbi:MAG: protein jag [Desulfovibrio piger]|uniref:Jag family protein n=1 Tax=Desulfovibrio piger TaxID=901 RepID=UPI00399B049D
MENTEDVLDEVEESLPFTPVEELDPQRLEALTKEAVRQLVRPIVGEEVTLEVTVADGRVRVAVDCEEDSGLLIGREGQTLASLQYLASRVVSRGMNAAVRVQLDAGRYRQRQDEKLREMALALAEKVRQTGRSYSTRPLSSYHRRIVHLCLQDAEEVQTRSSGDGPMKRVVIMRRRPERS